MESTNRTQDFESIFSNYDDEIENFFANMKYDKPQTLLSTQCYITFSGNCTSKPQKLVFTQKEMISNVQLDGEQKQFSVEYRMCWVDDVQTEYKSKVKADLKGAIRLIKRDFEVDLLFLDAKIYNTVREFQTKYAINLDFEAKFIVEERLGRGASANVYKITDPSTRMSYAGKFISKDYLKKTAKRIISVITEMEVLRKLDHPNIVKLHEVYEVEDYFIQVLELLEGEGLNADVFKNSNINEVTQIFSQIVRAIKYLNDHGQMHRDIKPSNQRFSKRYKAGSSNNTIKIIDFGFIEYFGNHKYTRYYCGTVGYMCPFVMNNSKHNPKNYGPEVDLYSQGVQLFYASTGQKIFNAKNHEEKRKLNKLNKINYDHIDNNQNLSEEAKDLIKKLLVADPENRINMKGVMGHPYFKNSFITNGTNQSNGNTNANGVGKNSVINVDGI